MRAIDADVLFREMEKTQWYNNADRDEIAEELVLNAPTIEPRCEACEAFNKTRLLIPQPEQKKVKRKSRRSATHASTKRNRCLTVVRIVRIMNYGRVSNARGNHGV